MKRWVAFILSFYILLSTVVPCSIFDKCEDQNSTKQTSQSGRKKDCSDCSPFSVCATHVFTINTESISAAPNSFSTSPSYSEYYFPSKSEYYFTHFQSPRSI